MRDKLSGDVVRGGGQPGGVEECMTGPEVSRVRGLRRHPRRPARRPLRTTSASATPTPVRTREAWAPTRRCRGWRPASSTRVDDDRRADAGGAAPPGHRLPRRALRRLDGHPRRPEAGRVQRALRRSGRPGGPPTAHLGPRRAPAPGGGWAAGRPAHRRPRRGGAGGGGGRGLPGGSPHRRPDRRARRRPERRRGHRAVRRCGRDAGRPGHRRRSGARRRRHRPGRRHRPRGRLAALARIGWAGMHHRSDIGQER